MATVVDKTNQNQPADADKTVPPDEHTAGVVTINGVPQEAAVVTSVGLAEYEVAEEPKPLAEGGVVAAPKTSTSGAGKKP